MRKKLLLGALFVVLINNAKADIILENDYLNNDTIKGEKSGFEIRGGANLINNGTVEGDSGILIRSSGDVGDIYNGGIIKGIAALEDWWSGNAIVNMASGNLGNIYNAGVIAGTTDFNGAWLSGNAIIGSTIGGILNNGIISGNIKTNDGLRVNTSGNGIQLGTSSGGNFGIVNNSGIISGNGKGADLLSSGNGIYLYQKVIKENINNEGIIRGEVNLEGKGDLSTGNSGNGTSGVNIEDNSGVVLGKTFVTNKDYNNGATIYVSLSEVGNGVLRGNIQNNSGLIKGELIEDKLEKTLNKGAGLSSGSGISGKIETNSGNIIGKYVKTEISDSLPSGTSGTFGIARAGNGIVGAVKNNLGIISGKGLKLMMLIHHRT